MNFFTGLFFRVFFGFICLHRCSWLSDFYYFLVKWLNFILNKNGTYVFRLFYPWVCFFFFFFNYWFHISIFFNFFYNCEFCISIMLWLSEDVGFSYGVTSWDKFIIFTNPSARAQGQFFKRSLTGLNSEFSLSSTSCLTKAEEPSPSYYLPIAGGRIIRFIPFPRVLVLCEMQSVSSRIWTRVAVSISCEDNHYTTGTSTLK